MSEIVPRLQFVAGGEVSTLLINARNMVERDVAGTVNRSPNLDCSGLEVTFGDPDNGGAVLIHPEGLACSTPWGQDQDATVLARARLHERRANGISRRLEVCLGTIATDSNVLQASAQYSAVLADDPGRMRRSDRVERFCEIPTSTISRIDETLKTIVSLGGRDLDIDAAYHGLFPISPAAGLIPVQRSTSAHPFSLPPSSDRPTRLVVPGPY